MDSRERRRMGVEQIHSHPTSTPPPHQMLPVRKHVPRGLSNEKYTVRPQRHEGKTNETEMNEGGRWSKGEVREGGEKENSIDLWEHCTDDRITERHNQREHGKGEGRKSTKPQFQQKRNLREKGGKGGEKLCIITYGTMPALTRTEIGLIILYLPPPSTAAR